MSASLSQVNSRSQKLESSKSSVRADWKVAIYWFREAEYIGLVSSYLSLRLHEEHALIIIAINFTGVQTNIQSYCSCTTVRLLLQ